MARADLRLVPTPDGEMRRSQSDRDKEKVENFNSLLVNNQTTFEEKGFNLFSDRKMLEATYDHFLDDYSGNKTLDTSAIAQETNESEPKVVLAIDILKSILGSPDYTPPAGGMAASLESDEETEERKAA